MHRKAWLTALFLTSAVTAAGSALAEAPKPPVKAAPAGPTIDTAPAVASLAGRLDGFNWGMTTREVIDAHTKGSRSIIWKDYDKVLARAQIGPDMQSAEAARDVAMKRFEQSLVRFEGSTGFDSTGLKGEYGYNNKETLLSIDREGRRRFFFFSAERLYKIYDQYPLSETGPYGKTFAEAVNRTNGLLKGNGRALPPDPAHGRYLPQVDWRDKDAKTNHFRLVDRSGEGVVGVAIEDLEVAKTLATTRIAKAVDPLAIDPTIEQVTAKQASDPNKAPPAPSGSAAPKKKK